MVMCLAPRFALAYVYPVSIYYVSVSWEMSRRLLWVPHCRACVRRYGTTVRV